MEIKITKRELRSEGIYWVTIKYINNQNMDLGYLKFTEPVNVGDEIIIQNLYVEPDARRKGIASTLINHVKQIAKESTVEVYIEPLEREITLNNLVSLFQKNGFYVRKINDNEAWGIFNPLQ